MVAKAQGETSKKTCLDRETTELPSPPKVRQRFEVWPLTVPRVRACVLEASATPHARVCPSRKPTLASTSKALAGVLTDPVIRRAPVPPPGEVSRDTHIHFSTWQPSESAGGGAAAPQSESVKDRTSSSAVMPDGYGCDASSHPPLEAPSPCAKPKKGGGPVL